MDVNFAQGQALRAPSLINQLTKICVVLFGNIGNGSPKPMAILSRQIYRCLHEHEHRRCVCDIFNLGVAHRKVADCCVLLGAVRRYIADGSWRRNIGKNFNACIEIFLDVPMLW